MKVIFISNFYNHHQACLCENLNFLTEGNFYFIQTMPMSEERLNMGWGVTLPPYVKKSYTSKNDYKECLNII